MRAGSFRKYFATHNPVRLFPEELKRTRSNIVTDAKSISKQKAQRAAFHYHDYPASKSMFAHTLCDLSCFLLELVLGLSWAAPLLVHI